MRSFHIQEILRGAAPGTVLPSDEGDRLLAPLTCLVGRTAARKLLAAAGPALLKSAPADELAAMAGVKVRLAERVVAARDFGFDVARPRGSAVRSSSDVLRALPAGLATLEVEVFLVLALSNTLQSKGAVLLAKGGDTSVSLSLRDVFRPLSRLGASAFVAVHTHPSGSPEPSREDIALTRKLATAGPVLGIELVDHVIVASHGTCSFLDRGLLHHPAPDEEPLPVPPRLVTHERTPS